MAHVSGSGTYVSANGEYTLRNSILLVCKNKNYSKSETCTKSSLYNGYCAPESTTTLQDGSVQMSLLSVQGPVPHVASGRTDRPCPSLMAQPPEPEHSARETHK